MAAALWGHGWSGKHVCFHCDNKAVVLMIQAHNAHEESLVQLLRYLFFYAAVFLFHSSATHISGVHNIVADAISHDNLTLLYSLVPQAQRSGPSTSDSIPVITTELGVTSLDSTVCALAANGLSANTSKSYRSGLNRYLSFCASYSLPAFPLSESTLCHFVASLVTEGMSYPTIRLFISCPSPPTNGGWPRPIFHLTTPSTLCTSGMPQVPARFSLRAPPPHYPIVPSALVHSLV